MLEVSGKGGLMLEVRGGGPILEVRGRGVPCLRGGMLQVGRGVPCLR